MSATRFLIATAACLTLLSCAAQGPNTPLPPSSGIAAVGVENRIVSYVNASRGQSGLRPLVRDARLDSLAREQARQLMRDGKLHHSEFRDRFTRAHALTGARLFAENAHVVSMSSDPARGLVEAWLGSKIHRDNILGSAWNHTGVGSAPDAMGRIWAVQVFAAVP